MTSIDNTKFYQFISKIQADNEGGWNNYIDENYGNNDSAQHSNHNKHGKRVAGDYCPTVLQINATDRRKVFEIQIFDCLFKIIEP